MLNQNQGNFYQFNVENKFSLLSGDFPTGKLFIVMIIVLLVFLSVIGVIVLKLIDVWNF